MQNREQRFVSGTLNFDDDPRYIKQGEYRDVRNMRGSRTDVGKDGSLENIKSTAEVTTRVDNSGSSTTLPNGVNKCVGTYTSDSTNRSFMWIWNSEGDHTIWEYNFKTDTLKLLIQDQNWTTSAWAASTGYSEGDVVTSNSQTWICVYGHSNTAALVTVAPENNGYYFKELLPYLNFGEFNLINDVVELTRDDDTLLIWTDGENEVKYINADRLGDSTRTDYPVDALEEEYFDLIPTTPALSIPIYDGIGGSSSLRSSGDNTKPNALIGKNYQFRYQWEYMDGIRSPWSPISKIAATLPSVSMYRGVSDFFKLRIPRRDSFATDTSYCKKIYVAVKEVVSGNAGDWYICKEIDATDTSQSEDPRVSALTKIADSAYGSTSGGDQYEDYFELDFYGDEPRLAVDVNEVNQLYSWLPKKARTLALVGDNRLFTANTTEGNNAPSEYIDNNDVSTSASFATATNSLTIPPYRSYKRGSKGKFGVIYLDKKGRTSSVIPFASETDIPWYNAAAMGSAKTAAYSQVFIELDSTPPDWATDYQIVWSKNRTYDVSGDSNAKFLQIPLTNPAILATDTNTGLSWYTADLDFIDAYDTIYEGSNKAVKYDFSEGDMLRAVYDNTGSDYFGNTTTIYEANITSYDPSTKTITFTSTPLGGNIPADGDWIEIYAPARVQLDDDELIWYEIGETFKVIKDDGGNLAHASVTDRTLIGSNADQTSSNGAEIYSSGGDVWVYTRSLETSLPSFPSDWLNVESPYIQDFAESKATDIGRPNIVTEEGLKEIHREATGRIGQTFIPNTDINNIGFFYDIDFTEYNKNFGSIQKVYTDSQNLTIFHETKFGQVPIQRAIIESLDGQNLSIDTADLLGKVRYSEEDYGISLNPESHVHYGANQFWCDVNRNAVLQLSPQGFAVISDINAKYYFDQLFQTIPPYSNRVKLLGGYDREFDEYMLTFDVRFQPTAITGQTYSGGVFAFDVTDSAEQQTWILGWEQGRVDNLTSGVGVNGFRAIVRYLDTVDNYYKEAEGIPSDIDPTYEAIEDIGTVNLNVANDNVVYGFFRDCIAFSPKGGGWSSRYDFEVDGWSVHGNKLASVKDGKFYKHNDIETTTYGNFYGTQYECFVELPFNEQPTLRKQPLQIEIESNDTNWYVSAIENNRGQQSNVPNNYFNQREGEIFAPILRDPNTPVIPNVVDTPLLEGNKLRGSYMLAKLSNTATTLVELFSSSVNYMLSNLR